jgi:hypothetical protein
MSIVPLVTRPRIASGILSIITTIALFAGAPSRVSAQSFDIASVPRPESAEISASERVSTSSVTYVFSGSRDAATAATERSLNAQGWLRYRPPDQQQSIRFKKARIGIYVSYSGSPGRPDQSRISYSHNNSIPANVPFPDDATDIVYDENRPYLRCLTALSLEASEEFFKTGLAAEGWAPIDPTVIASRWPHAKLADAIENSRRVYFNRERYGQPQPVILTLSRDPGGKTIVDLRVAPFALPKDLPYYQEFAGLPASQHYKRSGGTGSSDSPRREATALIIAELPVVLAFYRRELAARGYQEQAAGATISESAARITFSKPDDTAVLELRELYDMIDVRLLAQLSQAAIAARSRTKKDADDQWMRDRRKEVEDLMAASAAKRASAEKAIADAPVETLRPLANPGTPIPLPENAQSVSFKGDDGKLEYTSPSTPKSVAEFHRREMKTLGWATSRSPIDKPTMVRMDFTKGAQKIGLTVMVFGGNTRVTADGTGLLVPADPNKETERLEAIEVSGFPVPKNFTASAPGAWTLKGGAAAFRRDYHAQVPSDIGSVLALYRRELTKREWKERSEGAVIKPEGVALTFLSPEGPATLALGRKGKETTIAIVIKNPAEAKKAGLLPPSGMAKIVLGNIGDDEASLTINQKTFKIKPGTGNSKTPEGPMLDVKPGKYKYTLGLASKPNKTSEIVVGADEAWGLMVGPGGVLSLQMY